MEIKEFAFKKQFARPVKATIKLKCNECDVVEVRDAMVLYTGHMFEQGITYICSACRGDMTLIITANKKTKGED